MNTEHPTPTELPPYFSYLIRLWREDSHGEWRASAQSVQTKMTFRFASLEELFSFLANETARGGRQNNDSDQGDSADTCCSRYRDDE